MSLTGKVALVTGSTQGLGLTIAEHLARIGCSVIMTGSRSEEAARHTVDHINQLSGVAVDYIQCDLRKATKIDELCSRIGELYHDGIDILVNNAGINGGRKPITEISLDEWKQHIDINLTAPFLLIKHFVPLMKKKNWGRIVNINSRFGMVGLKNLSQYISSKHGLSGLTKAVALETAELGITCNSVNPGYMDTPLTREVAKKREEKMGMPYENIMDLMRSDIPTKKITNPTEIAEYVIFLCSAGAANMTGTVVPIDGGYTAQ